MSVKTRVMLYTTNVADLRGAAAPTAVCYLAPEYPHGTEQTSAVAGDKTRTRRVLLSCGYLGSHCTYLGVGG